MKSLVTQLCPTLCDPMDYNLCPWNSPGKDIGVGSLSLQVIFPNPGTEPKSPALQADSLPSEVIRLENSGVQRRMVSSSRPTRNMSSIW